MIPIQSVQLDGLRVAYRELGQGPPVLLVHGWPTSSFLWRNVMPHIARANRVVAIDLPGFGESDKPVGIRYNFAFFDGILEGFLAKLGIAELGLAVHDLGGPIGLHWAVDRPERVTRLALLNTLVYPEFSEAVKDFVRRPRDDRARRLRRSLQAPPRCGRRDAAALPDGRGPPRAGRRGDRHRASRLRAHRASVAGIPDPRADRLR
jgi:pimeloyl-ACP methyl ester carboxylesterase